MKNIPMFATAYGVATLILREIGWSGRAYVLVRSVWNDQIRSLLQECRGFCLAAGAEEVYASWEARELPALHHCDMLRMVCPKAALPPPRQPVVLEQVTPETAEAYLQIYNRCFRQVPAAASYDRKSLERLYGEELAWLAKVGGKYAAVAEISREGLEGIAVLPEYAGLGYDLLTTVLPMVPAPTVRLKVASTNLRARRLYDRVGFREDGVDCRWHRL